MDTIFEVDKNIDADDFEQLLDEFRLEEKDRFPYPLFDFEVIRVGGRIVNFTLIGKEWGGRDGYSDSELVFTKRELVGLKLTPFEGDPDGDSKLIFTKREFAVLTLTPFEGDLSHIVGKCDGADYERAVMELLAGYLGASPIQMRAEASGAEQPAQAAPNHIIQVPEERIKLEQKVIDRSIRGEKVRDIARLEAISQSEVKRIRKKHGVQRKRGAEPF